MNPTAIPWALAFALAVALPLAYAERVAAEEAKPPAPAAEKAPASSEEKPQATAPAKAPESKAEAPAARPETAAGQAAKDEGGQKAQGPEKKPPADEIEAWIKKSKNPVPWFKWGADLRIRDEWLNNTLTFNEHAHGHDRNRIRYRPRWWATITPVKGVELNGRLIWEGRYNSRPTAFVEQGEVLWDTMNLKLTDIGGSGIWTTVGRQELALGDNWLIDDGTPLDGSRSFYFDAYRLTYDAKPVATTFDAIFIHNKAFPNDTWLENLNSINNAVTEQNENGFIFWAANKSLPKTELDGYYVYKANERVLPNGDDGHIHAFGGRVAGQLSDHWQYAAEGVHEFGDKNQRTLQAYGFYGRMAYLFKDPHENQLRAHYEFDSGDDPHSRTQEQFDLLWGRWMPWSKLWLDHDVNETRKGETTNMHRLVFGWAASPAKNMELSADYHLMWADENTLGATRAGRRRGFSPDEKFRGQLFVALVRYKFTPHLSGHLRGELFFPGDFYLRTMHDPSQFLRAELVFSY
jgi:hypothetical protein